MRWFSRSSLKIALSSLLLFSLTVGLIVFTFFPSILIDRIQVRDYKKLGMTLHHVEAEGINFQYMEGGEGENTILFVHGFRSSKGYWLPYVPSFLPNSKVIVLDLPGHGGTSTPEFQKYGLMDLGKSLNVFIRALDLKEFDLVATSMGGGIALASAVEEQARMRKMALINPLAVMPPNLSIVHQELGNGVNLLLPEDMDGLDRMMKVVSGKNPKMSFLMKKLLMNYMLNRRDFYLDAFDQMVDAGAIDEVLPGVRLPILLIQGTHDQVVDPSCVDVFEELLSKLNVSLIEGGEHTLTGDHRQQAIELISDFLSEK